MHDSRELHFVMRKVRGSLGFQAAVDFVGD